MRRIADELRQVGENCVQAREDRTAAIADIRHDARAFVEELPPQIQEIKDETHVLLGELHEENEEIKADARVFVEDLRPQIQEIRDDTQALIGELHGENEEIRADARAFVEDLRPQIQEIKDDTHGLIEDLRPQIQEIKDDTHALIADLRPEIEEIRGDVREELADARQAMGEFARVRRPAKPKKALALVEADDLTQIQGLGPASKERLYNAGITTFAQLARSTPDSLQEQLGAVSARFDVEEWIEQARDLAA